MPEVPRLKSVITNVLEFGNGTNGSSPSPVPTTTTQQTPLSMPPCQSILYSDIGNSRVRIWDLIILIPNVLFLIFLLIKIRVAITKLKRTSSPIFFAFYGLVLAVAVISVLRGVVSMTVNAATTAGDYLDRILWLVLQFFLLATELSVVIFGLAFGHLDSQTSIRSVLFVTFTTSLIYSTTQGLLEFLYSHSQAFRGSFTIFGHGGMIFWFASSVFFFVVYTIICILPCTKCRERFALPTKISFYLYCLILSILNAIQASGSAMIYYQIQNGMCLVDVTTYIYFTCFAPLVYGTFLWAFFRSSQPPDILFSYKAHVDDEDEDTVHLPNQGRYPVHRDDLDAMTSSYDSTQIDTASPNPLYCEEFHFSPELSINADYFREEIRDDSRDDEIMKPEIT